MRSVNQSLAQLFFPFTGITKINSRFVINCIHFKTKRELIHFTYLNVIDKNKGTDTHKSVPQPIHQSTSPGGGSIKLYA